MCKKINYILLLIVAYLFPFVVDAAVCEVKPASTKYRFCERNYSRTGEESENCFETNADFPSHYWGYNVTEIRYCAMDGYTLEGDYCVRTDCFTPSSESNVDVELKTNSGVCNADASLQHEFKFSVKVGEYSSCQGKIDLVCSATVSIDSNYNFYFKDYQSGQPIKSLVSSSRKNQYAAGTGTTFEVLYGSNLSYSVTYDEDVIEYDVTEWDKCEECSSDGGGGGDGNDDDGGNDKPSGGSSGNKGGSSKPSVPSEIPKTCDNTLDDVKATQMGCHLVDCCVTVEHGSVDCRTEMNVSVEAIKASSSYVKSKYVNATSPTSKGRETQDLGVFSDSGTTTGSSNASQSFRFTLPSSYINIKTGQVLYKGINYNGQSTAEWKEVTPGYYIPTNALPEQNNYVNTAISGVAYAIKVNGSVFRTISVSGDLGCSFGTKISGCPYQDCGNASCNPSTDKYKCCRNSNYLRNNPSYYAKECGNVDSYIYRSISLTDPFPSRDAGENWYNWINDEKNKTELTKSYDGDAEYTMVLTNEMISKIKEYNNKEANQYTSWVEMNDDGSSSFLKDGTGYSISIGNNFSSNSSYYHLGCGPSNENMYGWCK